MSDAIHADLLREGDSWQLVVGHSRGVTIVRGAEGLRALSAVVSAVLSHGANAEFVSAAIDLIERLGGSARDPRAQRPAAGVLSQSGRRA